MIICGKQDSMSDEYSIPSNSFVPALVIGYFKEGNDNIGGRIAATPLQSELEINPTTVAAMMVSLYECCEDIVPESDQNNFEQATLAIFTKMMETRFGYTSKFKIKDE